MLDPLQPLVFMFLSFLAQKIQFLSEVLLVPECVFLLAISSSSHAFPIDIFLSYPRSFVCPQIYSSYTRLIHFVPE